jgi:hypothetical protein
MAKAAPAATSDAQTTARTAKATPSDVTRGGAQVSTAPTGTPADTKPGSLTTEGKAEIVPFVVALVGFFLTNGTDVQFGLLVGALVLIVIVSGKFAVRLGNKFLTNVEKYV